MADFGGTVLTRLGIDAMARAQTGAGLTITRAALGGGLWPEGTNPETVTALVEPRMHLPIQELEWRGDGTVRIQVVATNSALEEGFFMRELGVYARLGAEAEVLYAVAYAGEKYDYMPAKQTPVEKLVDIYIVVGAAQNVTASIDASSLLATQQWTQQWTEDNFALPTDGTNGQSLLCGAPHYWGHPFPGGEAGQVLTKQSGDDGDATWVSVSKATTITPRTYFIGQF